MDRGKKPLEKFGEWTTVHKRPNKGKTTNLNQGFVTVPAQAPFYPNQGYYIHYPMVRQPVGTHLSFTPKTTNGRRILAYDTRTGNIQEERDKESVQLLKMIADMEIDDFPSHVIQEIKNTWETWNSPRLSPRKELEEPDIQVWRQPKEKGI
ncbi:hypothetical protein Gotur_005004 [Gossypium turneri]